MKLGTIYETAVRAGMEADPRGLPEVYRYMEKVRQDYEALPEAKKERFDKERLTNPYADTRLLYGDPDLKVKCLIAGIDMEIGEVMLAERLNEKGAGIDLILAHHPEGSAMAQFYQVMHMQADIMAGYGVPVSVAEAVLPGRISEVERRVMPANHQRAVDAARLLNLPMMCIHTPCDNMVTEYLQKQLDAAEPYYLDDLIELLNSIPEYDIASKNNAGPRIVLGDGKRRSGKIKVDMTGGTGGPKEYMAALVRAGVSTIVGMHIGEENYKAADEAHLNVVIAGHISSDTIGMNLLLDKIEPVEVVECSGFRRIKR
ncbi:MAG: NGG1p interacting factor NIF3 [bacterium]|jgi:putative NIF3 family GTP cyclohydrolase 1 type 2|nr:NGG1p interacting factor NIF3 [bacterium]MDD3804905.1 NGG1p interacting factor NIF3 [bacterium]MDD4558676.1 NGG1p interacting factor NIF3 [bacterium]